MQKTVTPFFFSRKIVSKVHVTCHNHGHTSLSSARTFVEQNWPWLLSLALRNIVTSFFTSMSSERGGHLHEQHFNRIAAWKCWQNREKSTPKCFQDSVAHLTAQKLIWLGISFLFICLQYFQQKEGIAQTAWSSKGVRSKTQRESVTRRKMSHRNHTLF